MRWEWLCYPAAMVRKKLEQADAFRVYSDTGDMLMHVEQLGYGD